MLFCCVKNKNVIVRVLTKIAYVVCYQCIFLTWCMCSATWNGSDMIYKRLIRPFVLKHQKKIDEALDKASDKMKEGRLLVWCLKCLHHKCGF